MTLNLCHQSGMCGSIVVVRLLQPLRQPQQLLLRRCSHVSCRTRQSDRAAAEPQVPFCSQTATAADRHGRSLLRNCIIRRINPPSDPKGAAVGAMTQSTLRKASFGMGCFWGAEAAFGVVRGVIRTKVGYTGGSSKGPTYRSMGDHTETVELQYDPNQVTYRSLLDVFWVNHEPMIKQKRQYMSAIFYHDEDQKKEAEELLKRESAQRPYSIQTVLQPAGPFYDAEDYHQKYALRRHTKVLSALKLSDKAVIEEPIAARLNGYLNGYGSLKEFEQEAPALQLNEDLIKYLRTAIANAVRHC